MKKLTFLLAAILLTITTMAQTKTFHDFKVKDIDGNDFDLSSLKGKKVLVVNTASKCGFTPQYKDLQLLYEKFGSDKFVIIGFPANNFMSQEPGSNSEIKEFCLTNYNVTFPMMAKISVKGKDIHPLYEWLTSKEQNGVMDSNVKWNFQKYMIDENGKLVDVAYSKTNPFDDQVVNWITGK
ncbi:MAG: glutathione peroxidase [Bacteroidetes bacterium GWC2_33_15]|nr:MAG: glutathione peroxidase [Bacteroidetes bacterium GWA2_33_15]OFX50694.1 MAG: glutathione peroxidase [Bacteroidetes bacterium GWC2_33_15]OFX63211.1 MAG: glutathione peroxidase [Bacteroidetes bacterium GWB2_32_14]OFX69843.1 MAG: glutathione peroxidase [Bacteroidetes bacterium GWD2_33_33]HAN19890.1 glutathione peroxidase [Bacteroidales bacterium]